MISGMVVFRIKGENDLTERLLKRLNHRGNIHCVPASLKGKYVIRYDMLFFFWQNAFIFYGSSSSFFLFISIVLPLHQRTPQTMIYSKIGPKFEKYLPNCWKNWIYTSLIELEYISKVFFLINCNVFALDLFFIQFDWIGFNSRVNGIHLKPTKRIHVIAWRKATQNNREKKKLCIPKVCWKLLVFFIVGYFQFGNQCFFVKIKNKIQNS